MIRVLVAEDIRILRDSQLSARTPLVLAVVAAVAARPHPDRLNPRQPVQTDSGSTFRSAASSRSAGALGCRLPSLR